MSMGEFEEQLNTWEDDSPPLAARDCELPLDFSKEDLAFAQELDTLFSIQHEELPPYLAQTLLEAEDPRFQAVEPGFELKTRARVFRRLKLRQQLVQHRNPRFFTLPRALPGRRLLVTSAVFMFIMFVTVMYTAPSFASGMEILLHGTKTGVMLVNAFPGGVHHSRPVINSDPRDTDSLPTLGLQAAISELHSWNLYWPKAVPDNYLLTNTYFYQEPDQSWADGPFMELDYSLTGKTPLGTGQLAIREFKLKPNVNVLQVVKNGAAQTITVDASGNAQAIYVDGQWIMHNKNFPVWVYGQRGELIYQKGGIVFWIVADQRDGIGRDELYNIANSLQPFHVNRVMHMGNENSTNTVTMANGDINGPFAGDVLAIYPNGGDVGPYLSLVGDVQIESPSTVAVSSGLHSR